MLFAESISQSTEFCTVRFSLYIPSSAESASCIELSQKEVASVAGRSLSPLALLPSLRVGGSEMCVTVMFLINL